MSETTRGPYPIAKPYLFAESDIDLPGTVYLSNGRDPAFDFGQLADAYHKGAKAMVKALAQDTFFIHSKSLSATFRLFPVIHMYRHALELCIKGILLGGEGALTVRGKPGVSRQLLYSGHKLILLWTEIERVFDALPNWTYDMRVEGWRTKDEFRARLQEFHDFDPDGMVTRYPITKKDEPSMRGHWLCMNVFEFAAKMDAVLEVLRGLPFGASEEVEHLCEMIYEAQAAAYENADFEPDEYCSD